VNLCFARSLKGRRKALVVKRCVCHVPPPLRKLLRQKTHDQVPFSIFHFLESLAEPTLDFRHVEFTDFD
jgi:hypothetical protein